MHPTVHEASIGTPRACRVHCYTTETYRNVPEKRVRIAHRKFAECSLTRDPDPSAG